MYPALIVPGVLLAIACVFDLRTREIPDAFPILLVVWGVVSRALGFQAPDWWGLALGLAAGLAVGLLLFRLGAVGGGDAKLFAGLGACLGPLALGIALAWIAAVGGLVAAFATLRGRREIAYGPAIAIGYVLAVTVT